MGANAQTTVPKYTALTVLPAASMNISAGTGIPVFASTVTRDAAFGGANKVLAEGQTCYLESTNVVQFYDGAAWASVGAGLLQLVSTTKTDTFTTTSSSFTDVTGLSVTVTPSSASNKIMILVNMSCGTDETTSSLFGQLVRGATAIAIGDAAGSRTSVSFDVSCLYTKQIGASLSFLDSPATTAATTYKIQIASPGSSTIAVNRSQVDSNEYGYSRSVSTITAMEISG